MDISDRVLGGSVFGCLGMSILVGITSIVALITHIVACIKAGAILLLIVGCLLPFVGVIHGIMIWLGIPWVVPVVSV